MNKYFKLFADNKELSLTLLIICVLAMIIVPIPHQMMDVLISINIGLTILILMVVINMKSPIELTSFPTILLVLALFRIGITISTSRLILLEGDAGKIVSTFGHFVVGGNLVVGIIIFCIITLINFIVITKGSERVAEVAARFSLDAMPGKQMSIDSDLRAGNIDMEEAKSKRNILGLESKLYGAMDGAMKFVKGDAIASIVDIAINLIGGLIIGIAQRGMDFSSALSTYTILTVGDGLVQQVPALLISLTAGMMITRVSDDDSKVKENLGVTMLNQVFKSPKALFSASLLFILLAFVPGMPSNVFITLFILIIALAIYIKKLHISNISTEQVVESNDQASANYVDDGFVSWKVQPLILHLSYEVKATELPSMIKSALIEVRRNILINLGVNIPQIVISYSPELEHNSYKILIYEVAVATGIFYKDCILIPNLNDDIEKTLSISKAIPNTIDIGTNYKGSWVSKIYEKNCNEFAIPYLSLNSFLVAHLSKVLRENIAEFFSMQEVKELMDTMVDYQDLIRELLRMLPLNKITEILQRLLAEGIPIRNFKTILNATLEWAQREKEVIIITEYVRQSLGRYIADKYSNGTYVIPCFLLDSTIEDLVRDSIRFNEYGSYLSIDPRHSNDIIEALQNAYNSQKHLNFAPVIITQMDIRRYLRSIIEKDMPFLHVLSFQEVEAHAKFNSLGVIEL